MGLGLGILPYIKRLVYPIYNKFRYPILYKHQQSIAVEIRRKENISVLFVLTSLAAWKTENIYKAMSKSNKFSVDILVTVANDEDSRPAIKEYLTIRKFHFFELKDNETIYSRIVPDIIFYEKPYDADLTDLNLRYDNNNKSVFCYVSYSMHDTLFPSNFLENNPLQNIAFQVYFENKDVAEEVGKYKTNKGVNHVVTGHPASDNYLLFDNKKEMDPWKPQDKYKKRIIYAPHHTIDHANEWLPYSTFLEFGEFMLEIAEKYRDEVQFAFKPHPSLKKKLIKLWGKERTEAYYNRWKTMYNCQLETGEYTNLFMFSDALIHDCGSFQIEYHYTHNPVMYLTHDEHGHREGLTHFAQKAFDLHYKGHCKTDIEQFIQNVIKGVDPLKEKRMEYYKNYLLPPNGKTATENIIDAILGEGNYK